MRYVCSSSTFRCVAVRLAFRSRLLGRDVFNLAKPFNNPFIRNFQLLRLFDHITEASSKPANAFI